MQWSTYNTLFHSDRFGNFIYNALSNSFLQLDELHYLYLEGVQNGSAPSALTVADEFLTLLQKEHIIVQEGEEEQLLMASSYRRKALASDYAHLNLSICPTLGCNFGCAYCFERTQQSRTVMNAATAARLIAFIRKFEQTTNISITWYGGEPTMAWDVIRNITRSVKELGIAYEDAGLVTNGYLLQADKIAELNELNIRSVQITIDGPEATHDARRRRRGGGPTYRRILENVETLMHSSYAGECRIRINLDKSNLSAFFEERSHLLNRFKSKPLFVYAGHIDTPRAKESGDNTCSICAEAWADFTIEQYRDQTVAHGGSIYPKGNVFNICCANTRNSFVVGPDGELYKCWEDVGQLDMVLGSIWEDDFITNSELMVQYNEGTDPYLDAECRACKVLPICGGGCANRRLRAKYFHEEGLTFCSLYKHRLVAYLLEYYDAFMTREMCSNLLQSGRKTKDEKGYRMVHPERRC